MELMEAVGEFAADLRLNGRAEGTIKKHVQELRRLARWVADRQLDWPTMNRRTLQQYTRLRAERGHSCRSNMLCTLRTFFAWCVEQEYCLSSPAVAFKTPKKPQPLPRSLTMEQTRTLIAALNGAATKRDRRDRALLLTALYAGLRCRELASLRWSDVDFKAGAIAIEISKMGKGRAVPLHPELHGVLSAWRAEQALRVDDPVFALDGNEFKPTRVGKIATQWRERSGVSFSAHVLRHTFATFALRASHDVYAVSKALGHAQLKQTEIYVSADVERLRCAIDKLPTLASW